jgi:hypothetical protein
MALQEMIGAGQTQNASPDDDDPMSLCHEGSLLEQLLIYGVLGL